jgi:hypothetical protein
LRGLAEELGAVLMALGGAALAQEAKEEARRRFTETAVHAGRAGLPGQAAQAWMAVGVLAAEEGSEEAADRTLGAARVAADRGGLTPLREQIERLSR